MNDERRKDKRVSLLIDISWEAKTGKYEARTSDLSTGGCFVDTIAQATVGEQIHFKLQIPSGDWMELDGEVTYSYPNIGFGIRFINLSEVDQQKLAKMVQAQEA
jgi:c-di-GMP-binding flagellar brake protein YcgR